MTTELVEHACFLTLCDNHGPKKASGNGKITVYMGLTNPT